MEAKKTPAIEQYLSIKKRYENAILMFRMGDFYEMFYEDAEKASKILQIALTAREFGKSMGKVPMCGVPCHSAESYIAKLVKNGYSVAICEQLEEAKPGRKIVKRDVVRVITPGTFFEDDTEDRVLMSAVWESENSISLAWMQMSTGDFYLCTCPLKTFTSILSKFKPAEVIIPQGCRELENIIKKELPYALLQVKDRSYFQPLPKYLQFQDILETPEKSEPMAIAAIERFVKETQIAFLPELKPPCRYSEDSYMFIDSFTQRNLELTEPLAGSDRRFTLFGAIDRTRTPMGRRLLKFSILHPLLDIASINQRLDAVDNIRSNRHLSERIDSVLSGIYDIERLLSKITSGLATPRDVVSLKHSIKKLPELKEILTSFSSELLLKLADELDPLYDVYCEIDRILVDDPPSKAGNIIRENVMQELDELKSIKANAELFIMSIEKRERERTGINSLKVGFNNVFGYYIEVSKPNLDAVPQDYIRKQTLVNAERFITPELKSFEEKVLSAQERIERLENKIFANLRNFIKSHVARIQKTSRVIATVDMLLSFAKIAAERNYIRPTIKDGFGITIKDGKHPVLEQFLEEDFMPNSVRFDRNSFVKIITGPNMGGKSVFLRQTALLVLMAQMGCHVPAKEATIGVVDRIFSRVGASDNLGRGVSTFMMEMVETSNILRNATSKSLIILDEVGRGTGTDDGISIASAIIEYMVKQIKAKTLFATHYYELTELEKNTDAVENLHVEVKEFEGQIVFTHRVIPGPSEKSYGIHVARLAGIPDEVIYRADEILQQRTGISEPRSNIYTGNPSVPDSIEKEIIRELETIEVSSITPLDAIITIARLKEKLKHTLLKYNTKERSHET